MQDGYNRIGDTWTEPLRMGFLGKKAKARRLQAKRHKKHELAETCVQFSISEQQGWGEWFDRSEQTMNDLECSAQVFVFYLRCS